MMTESELDQKFIAYAKKYPFDTCVFHHELNRILAFPIYLKQVVSLYIDIAEEDPEIDHINSFRLEKQTENAWAIFYSYTPK
ncbi:MAG: hypothetical protein IPP15_06645 [Saprospiraceae bacterium]|uniref:Uncharacterized protein n=1 Tax=Candidatus Opimibacter skivensis TaxID=2982028 RepID=A0A9D7XS46_9BACT|nr:hypothetical protein [Candidatus Opimibacter skivensis]